MHVCTHVKDTKIYVCVVWKTHVFTYMLGRCLAQIHSSQTVTNTNSVSFPNSWIDH